MTDSTLDRLLTRVGTVAERDQQQMLDRLESLPVGRTREEAVAVKLPAPLRMYVSCDGITYRTRYREPDPVHRGEKRVVYQEMKVGSVFWQDAKERWHKQVVTASMAPGPAFGKVGPCNGPRNPKNATNCWMHPTLGALPWEP